MLIPFAGCSSTHQVLISIIAGILQGWRVCRNFRAGHGCYGVMEEEMEPQTGLKSNLFAELQKAWDLDLFQNALRLQKPIQARPVFSIASHAGDDRSQQTTPTPVW
jgi:hypothetical protein